MTSVRLLPFGSLTGARNMAADEALLASAADRGVASLRFYTWDAPTLSLGYFQPTADRLTDRRLEGMDWVRRATGGAAIVHDPPHEITYALALPSARHWHMRGEPWICRMHHIIRDALAGFGVSARAVGCVQERKLGPVLCFLHQTMADLVVEGAKVAGSAQRKQRGAILQHGSILLSRSPLAPDLPGVAERSGVAVDRNRLVAAIGDDFMATTGWRLEPGDWTPQELADRDRIAAERYTSAGWNEKR